VELMERVVGSDGWVRVEHPVGRLMGCGFGFRMPSRVVGWGILGSVVMTFGWFNSGRMLGLFIFLLGVRFGIMCIVL